jgi:peptidoglycan/LPS O-acetylase OafA/YrhL
LADGRGILGRILSRREFVYLGAVSFALYLLHVPAIWLMRNMREAPVFGALLFGSIVLHEAIEKPARRILTEARWFRCTSQADQARVTLGGANLPREPLDKHEMVGNSSG